MIDVLYILLVVGFFAVCIWLIDALEKLKE
jgi:preprotein translocase subunit SecE